MLHGSIISLDSLCCSTSQSSALAMKSFALVLLMAAAASAATISMNQHTPDAYNFHYAAGDAGGHSRSESGHGGNVAGSYSYVDAFGDTRQVSYTAGPQGFVAHGDTGVAKQTALQAAAVNALAPKAPPAVAPVAPIHHYGYGHHGYGHLGYGHHVYGAPGGYVAVW